LADSTAGDKVRDATRMRCGRPSQSAVRELFKPFTQSPFPQGSK
jgi:hypothetical protein